MTRGLKAEGESGVEELAQNGELGNKDIVLFFSYRADDERDLELVDKIKASGAAIVIICPFEPEMPSGNDMLKDSGDIAIDTVSGDEVGAVEVAGLEVKICPTSGIADVMAAYAVLGNFVTTMVTRGKPPSAARRK